MRGAINSTLNLFDNRRHNGMDVISYIFVSKANHLVSKRLQIFCSCLVIFLLLFFVVRFAIYLDKQPCFGAIKINDEKVNWVLASEFVFQVPVPQVLPQRRFGWSLWLAQFSRELTDGWVDAMEFFYV